MTQQTTDPSHIDWEDILTRLIAYAHALSKGKPWFRGENTDSFLEGKQAYDYAMAAIVKYMDEPAKFDPSKGELIDYLKYNLVRTVVNNDLRRRENQTTIDVFAKDHLAEEDEYNIPYSERVLPYTKALFADTVDYANVKAYIENEIKGDKIAEEVLCGIYIMNLKPREVMDEFNMTPQEYNNGYRRLQTALNSAAKHYTGKTHTA